MHNSRLMLLLLTGVLSFGLPRQDQAAETASPGLEYRDHGIVRGPTDSQRLALVFTGHGFAEGGEAILKELAKHHAKGSFFFTGDFLTNPAFTPLVQRLVKEGHYLGPHSDKHVLYCSWEAPKTTLVSEVEFKADLERNLEKVERFGLGRGQVRYFLPAYEHYNEQIVTWARDMGLTVVNYTPGTRSNADYTGEADKNFVSSQTIFDSIVAKEQRDPHGLNGFLLLLHIGSGPGRQDKFAARFGALLDYLGDKGYQCVRVDQLLGQGVEAATVLEAGRSVPARRKGSGHPQGAGLLAHDGGPGRTVLPKQLLDVFLRASQLGYRPADTKIGIALGKAPLPAAFAVVAAGTGETRFEGRTKPVTDSQWGEFGYHAELDFSAFRTPGQYVLKLGEATSLPFTISPKAYDALPDELLEFMRQQRCGYNPWLDAVCHPFDGRTAFGPLTNGTYLDARGGWHDAADLLKYLLTSGNATAQMLLAYELRNPKPRLESPKAAQDQAPARAVFADQVNALGQPGANGIPDVLDEARWGLEWMLKLHPAPDQLYHQVADDRDHAGRRLPQNENVDYGWGKGGARVVYYADGQPQGLRQYQSESTGLANLAGRYTAAMALAYQIWKDAPQQGPFAERCLQAGKEVYELGRAKEGVQQGNSYSAPYRYEETTWADDMEWGAAELFRATGEHRYLSEARRYAKLAAAEGWMGQEQTRHYQYYPFMNVGHYRLYDLVDRRFQRLLAEYYREGIERCLRAGQKNPYRIGVPFIWCSNNLTVALATQCLLYERMTGDTRYRAFTAEQRDWLLGRNPWGYTMFTEVGSVSPKDPHLMTMQLTHCPVRGGLVDGPVYERIFKSLKGVSITEPDPLAAFQGPAVYHDDTHDYSSNEPTMDGTASAILLWSLCSSQNP